MRATIAISRSLYRWHQVYPDFLPTLLARATQVVTDEAVEWNVTEGEYPYLCTDIDFELQHPAQRPMGGQMDWQLSGCATTALMALRYLAEREEQRMLLQAGNQ